MNCLLRPLAAQQLTYTVWGLLSREILPPQGQAAIATC